jgi:hypothetical protein
MGGIGRNLFGPKSLQAGPDPPTSLMKGQKSKLFYGLKFLKPEKYQIIEVFEWRVLEAA